MAARVTQEVVTLRDQLNVKQGELQQQSEEGWFFLHAAERVLSPENLRWVLGCVSVSFPLQTKRRGSAIYVGFVVVSSRLIPGCLRMDFFRCGIKSVSLKRLPRFCSSALALPRSRMSCLLRSVFD